MRCLGFGSATCIDTGGIAGSPLLGLWLTCLRLWGSLGLGIHVQHTIHAVLFITYISHSSPVDRHTLVQVRQQKVLVDCGQRVRLS